MCIETIKTDLKKCTKRLSLEESKDREMQHEIVEAAKTPGIDYKGIE